MELKLELLQVALLKAETKDRKECLIMEENLGQTPLIMISIRSNLIIIIKRFHEHENR